MHINYVFHDVNEALPVLLSNLSGCDEVGSRAGRTKEMTHVGITLTDPLNREILLDHRKPNIAAQIAETMWVLAGRDDMEFLTHYLPRAMDFSDDGKRWRAGYGKRLRNWETIDQIGDDFVTRKVDQLAYVVDLLRRDPGTRQAVMSIWDPAIDTEPGKDIPCNDWLHFISRLGYLDLHVALRSNDIIWGWSGINQFEWSALLEVVAGLTGLKVGSLHFSTTSFHIYDRHWAKGDKIADAALLPGNRWRDEVAKPSPRFDVDRSERSLAHFDSLCEDWFRLEYDIRTGSPLVGGYIDRFPEPMLKSWLVVLDWWWNGRHSALQSLGGTRLEMATHYSVQPPSRPVRDLLVSDAQPVEQDETLAAFVGQEHQDQTPSQFVSDAIRTHIEKHKAYGHSWKKRGESFSIIPNIARKVDRIGTGVETSDETAFDTAMDLMVYCAKYLTWLDDQGKQRGWLTSDYTEHANALLLSVDREIYPSLNNPAPADYVKRLQGSINERFENLVRYVEDGESTEVRAEETRILLRAAYRLAAYLYGRQDEYRGADVD